MKKLTALLISCFLIVGLTTTAQAQSPISFGLKGGLNIADVTGSDMDTSTRTGLTGGLALHLNLPALPVGIESGLFYSQKGTVVSFTDPDFGSIDGTFKLDYLEIPVLAKLGLGAGPINPHLLAGPYLGFNLNAEVEGEESGFSFSEDISDDVNSTDFGLMFGAGLDFNLGVTALSAQARYSLGLTDIFEDDDEGLKHGVFSVVVGINF